MPKTLTLTALALFLATPALAQSADQTTEGQDASVEVAEAETEVEVPMRPGAEPDAYPVSDGLAECGAVMAAAGNVSTSFIERDNMVAASGEWFAVAADTAVAEGAEQPIEIVFEKTEAWMAQIGSVRQLSQTHRDWLAYCAHIGAEHGLDTRLFAERLN